MRTHRGKKHVADIWSPTKGGAMYRTSTQALVFHARWSAAPLKADPADGSNGWAIQRPAEGVSSEEIDEADAESLYRLLEEEVVPLYYTRDARDIPQGWVERMRSAIRESAAHFTADRMVREYTETYYAPVMRGEPGADDPPIR